jgi:pilus assembly protein FimV
VASKPAAAVAKAAPVVKPRADAQAQPPVRNAPPPTRPRLVMEPLDLSVEAPMPALHATPEMARLPQTSSEVREQAAAAWKALSTDPKEVAARESERVQALEAQLKALQAKAAQERSAVADLRERLEAMEQDRFGSSWIYGLGLLLALALAALAWMWLRLKESQERVVRSWRDSVALAAAHDKALDEHYGEPSARDTWLDSDDTLPPTISQELPQRASPAAAPAVPVAVPAATLEPKAASVVQAVPEPVATQPAPVEAPVQSIVNLEDLFDLLQQAEFFISVGEHDQAIEVLKKHIAERGEQSPFAYLELLRLYHQLGRADDYEQLRTQFLRHFNAQLPGYAQFHAQGRGLDHYVDALAEIEAQWTSSSVLALLEGYLFLRDGALPTHPAFEPAAYDDLLLLLAIAQTTPASSRGDPPPRKRTTPFGAPVVPVMPEVERVNDWGMAGSEQPPMISDRSIDSLIGDLALEPQAEALPVERPISEAMLDLDLSAPPPIMLDDVVEAPRPKPQATNKAVGFGSINDKIEFSFELEPQSPKKD